MSPAEVKGNDGLLWPNTMDAVAWARAFMLTKEVRPGIGDDEETMVGWFANAIMKGYDTAQDEAAELAAGASI